MVLANNIVIKKKKNGFSYLSGDHLLCGTFCDSHCPQPVSQNLKHMQHLEKKFIFVLPA